MRRLRVLCVATLAMAGTALGAACETAPVNFQELATSRLPHIYARNLDDLFFAQGFVQAQDRLWQMDMYRRASSRSATSTARFDTWGGRGP